MTAGNFKADVEAIREAEDRGYVPSEMKLVRELVVERKFHARLDLLLEIQPRLLDGLLKGAGVHLFSCGLTPALPALLRTAENHRGYLCRLDAVLLPIRSMTSLPFRCLL